MNKILLLSIYASFALSSGFTNPLPLSSRSIDNGGTYTATTGARGGTGGRGEVIVYWGM